MAENENVIRGAQWFLHMKCLLVFSFSKLFSFKNGCKLSVTVLGHVENYRIVTHIVIHIVSPGSCRYTALVMT